MYVKPAEFDKKTNQGLDVFKYYFPNYKYGSSKAKLKIRPDEKTASAVITLFANKWRITDFGNQSEVNSKTAIDFVMWHENFDYSDAIRFINDVILGGALAEDFSSIVRQSKLSYRPVTAQDKTGTYNFTEKKEVSESDLKTIGRYVDEKLLKKYNCKVLQKYERCYFDEKRNHDIVQIHESTDTFPIFLFDWGEFYRIYTPYAQKKYRFQFAGNKPKNFVYGLEQIRKADNEFTDSNKDDAYDPPPHKPLARVREIFRCSGETDALNLASLGYHVYWLNSESVQISYQEYNEIDQLCEKHYQILDLDATGLKQAMKIAKKHINLLTLKLPDYIQYTNDWRGNPCKDVKDYVNTIGDNISQTAARFTHLKRIAKPMKFWTNTTDKNGKSSIAINMIYLYNFLAAHGFYSMDSVYHKKANACYAKIDNKIITLIHPDDIKKIVKRFIENWICSKEVKDEIDILNKIITSAQISESNLQTLPKIDPSFVHHSQFTEYIHFQDCSLKIEPNRISTIKHDELKNYILGELVLADNTISHIIPKKLNNFHPNYSLMPNSDKLTRDQMRTARENFRFKPAFEVVANKDYQILLDNYKKAKTNHERETLNTEMSHFPELDRFDIIVNDDDFIFTSFLKDLSHRYWRKEIERKENLTIDEQKEQKLFLVNLLFGLGWNCAQFKDKGKPWMHVIQDLKISDVGKSSGRSGKSLYSDAIDYVRPSYYIGAREKTITEKTEFIYDGFTVFHNNINIDDFYEYGDFGFFYTQISGKRTVNSKFISKQTLPYELSGKMRMTTNFELANTDSSTLARVLSSGISDYYHEAAISNDYIESRSPLTKYGRRLYDDFSETEWAKFYIQIAHCIQMTMKFQKIAPPMGDIMKRQALRAMTKGLSKDNEFWSWANNFFVPKAKTWDNDFSPIDDTFAYLNCYIPKKHCYEAFKSTLPIQMANKYKATTFKQSLMHFCQYYNYELNPEHLCGKNDFQRKMRRITKTIDGQSTECIIIKTAPLKIDETVQENDNVSDANMDDDMPF